MPSQTPGESYNQEQPAQSTILCREETAFIQQSQRTGYNDALKTSSKDESFTDQSQEPGKGEEGSPSTGISQEQSLASQNQEAGKDGYKNPPINTSQDHSLPSQNQAAGKDGGGIPSANKNQKQKKLTHQVRN